MTQLRAVILSVASATCVAVMWTAITTPGIAMTDVTHQTLPAAAASKTPDVTTSLTREGAQIDGWQGDLRRFPSKPVNPDAEQGQTADQSNDNRFTEKPKQPRRVPPTEFRLNIGVCGRPAADGTIPGPTRCQPFGPEETVTPTPGVATVRVPRPQDVLWEQVLTETKNVLFPRLSVKVQPEGRTLVNLDTIVYTDESTVSTTQVSILGFPVDVEATPMSYVWSFGDGATVTTMTPGKPYPAKEITHRYHKRGGVSLTLTTNYAARFRIAGGPWQYVDGTVPITGPATPLLVREAVPVLVDPGR
jgi:hypothetical protein